MQGLLNFTEAEVKCSQVEIALTMRETTDGGATTLAVTHDPQLHCVESCVTKAFAIVIPNAAPPSFQSEVVEVTWEIEIKLFLVGNGQKLVWCLPFSVLPRSERSNVMSLKSIVIP